MADAKDLPFFFSLFGAAVFAFLAALLVIAIRRTIKAKRCRAWPNVTGTVLESLVVAQAEGGPGRNRAYVPQVTYEYRVNDARYEGTAITVCDSSLGWGWSEKVVGRYPPRAAVTVFYDPENPSDALLEPRHLGGLLLFYAFIIVAAGFMAFMLVAVKRATDKSRVPNHQVHREWE